MNGFISKASVVCLGGGLFALAGCFPYYHNVVDPCYPERYECMARGEVNQMFGAQVRNGHVLDQTVWNTYFEPGTARLLPAGQDRLLYLTRRRPNPDPVVYLQTAHDIPYDASAPDKFARGRASLDADRVVEVQKYLAAQTAGAPVAFTVLIHNPAPADMSAVPANNAVRIYQTGTSAGIVPVGVGGAGSGGGGGSAGGTGGTGTTGSF